VSLLHRITDFDGHEALSEHKATHIGEEAQSVAVVGTRGARLVAYAHGAWHAPPNVRSEGHWAVEVALAPEARHAGSWLEAVESVVALVPQPPGALVWAWREAMADELAAAGYQEVRNLHVLERQLPLGLAPEFPPAVDVRPFVTERDEGAWVEANNEAFAGHPENARLTVADLTARMQLPWFRSEDLLMAWEGDELIGSCWTKRRGQGLGEIYIIGVRPRFRGRGLGRALLLAGLEHLARVAGATSAILYVDGSNDAAVWLYRDLGFHDQRVGRLLRPPQRPQPPP
jgi:mycothiol synthase